MLKQTIIWTALPNGIDGPLQEGATVRLSVFLAPRLWSDTPEVTEKLASYPDWLDWPAKVQGASFTVDFGDGLARPAGADFSKLRPDLWKKLFKDSTDVIPFQFQDYSGSVFENGPVAVISDMLKGVYQDVGTDPAMGSGKELPKALDLSRQPTLGAIGRPYVPERPYEPPPHKAITISGEEPPPYDASGPGQGSGPGTGPGTGQQPGGCLSGCLTGCLMLPVQILKGLTRLLGMALMAPFMATTVNVPPAQAQQSSQQLIKSLKPYQDVPEESPEPLPTAEEIKATYDFHSMIASAGDYRWLLRALGLVLDLTVTLQAPLPATTGAVKVTPILTLSMANSSQISMRSHYDLGNNRFLANARPANPEISDGLLMVNDPNRYRVVQVDAVGGGVKLINLASNLPLLSDDKKNPENSPDEAGLPALRTAGLALVKPNLAKSVHEKALVAYAHNAFVANIDGSPLKASASPAPPPPATDELFAEDLVRGYCIDVFDDHSSRWHSLCQRVGTYDFGDGVVESGIVDEGFVVLGATEPAKKIDDTTPQTLRMFETLVTWNGWSLVAPRPGKTILSEVVEPQPGQEAEPTAYKTAYPSNPAVTNFPLSTSFSPVQGSLPRLRFGWNYRLRARAVDLAGDPLFGPEDSAAFQADVVQKTAGVTYGRFEPVDPPPLVLKEEPALGESLERLVLSSTIFQSANDIKQQTTERHIVPPKTSQLMVEQLGHFDGAQQMLGNQAAYELASREAGTLLEALDLTTGELKPAPGTKVVESYQIDPGTGQPALDAQGNKIVLHTFYLQTADDFVLTYLPDPLARGVLLLGLPGMTGFDQVIEPGGGQIVNKIPFDGPWPNPKPFRLRLQGLKENETPALPHWDGGTHLLTVQLAQGESAEVRISSYFAAGDLEKMGVWQWIEETGVAELGDLKNDLLQGRNWMHLPWRTLNLVHAVQQPLKVPTVDSLAAIRGLGDTGAALNGQITVDGKSTGKIDLRATWQDPFDDLGKPAFDSTTDVVSQDMHVREQLLEDGTTDTVQAVRWPHELGDTKYHHVTYQALGTTRFREYFPPPLTDAETRLMMRPLQGDIDDGTAGAARLTIHVDNTARPDAPKLVYVVPTFLWENGGDGVIFSHRRVSGGLRVYLERPWFSSGAGELLGVLTRPGQVQDEPDTREALSRYVSQWGMDPIWFSARTEPLRRDHLDENEIARRRENLSLEEAPRDDENDERGVDVYGYEVHFDATRGLWFAEVIFKENVVTSYFPFVRLALARFQPRSVGNERNSAHLSRVVRADYVQLPPERVVEYDTAQMAANKTVYVKVSGPAGLKFEQPSRMLVTVEERDPLVVDVKDPLGWRPLGKPVFLQADLSQAPERVVWQGALKLPDPRPAPVRLLVREWEVLPADEEATVRPPWEKDEPKTPGLVEFKSQRTRTVFADELILP